MERFILVKSLKKKFRCRAISAAQVSFYPFTQDEYLTIVEQWLASFDVDTAAIAAARAEALVWSS